MNRTVVGRKNDAQRLRSGPDWRGTSTTQSPEWLAQLDEAYLAAKIVHCFRDLGRQP